MTFSRIAGTGGYLPERVMHNKEFEKLVETSDEWIRERTGIKRRHVAADNETTSDMGLAAAREAIDAADLSVSDIDLIIVATTTPDKVFPSTACIVQRRLKLHTIPAFDIHAACSGFIYALDVADRFIRTGGATHALVIGSETYSRIIDWSDRGTCVLFGDGAGAIVLTAADEPGIMSTHIHSDGAFEEALHVPAGISSGYVEPRVRLFK
jgi:3-oxoacyl-[acyl-carrier-protein] synthase-3